MHVTLIKPNMGIMDGGGRYVDAGRMEPLQLGVLAALTPSAIHVDLVDDRCEPIPYERQTDLVAITVETFTARRGYEIAEAYRARGVPVVLGGFHPTLCPGEAAQHADSLVIGNAEDLWPEVLDDAAAGTLRLQYHTAAGSPRAHPVAPRRDLFAGKGYLPLALVEFGRGCPNGCDYCAVGAYSHHQHTHRPVSEVVAEIQGQARKLVFFVDDNIAANADAAKELFAALIPLKIRWVSQGTIDMVEDAELMTLMKRSGCLGHVIGFETLDARNLAASGKPNRLTDTDGYAGQIAAMKAYGLQTWAAFTLGYDHDTVESLEALLRFSLKHRFTFAAYNVLMPYPGTPFHERLQAEGRLLYEGKWWLHPDYRFNHAPFMPVHMTPQQLTETAFAIRKRWSSAGALVRRFLDLRTNLRSLSSMGLFWSYNHLFRTEMHKKQGMRFGYRPDSARGAHG